MWTGEGISSSHHISSGTGLSGCPPLLHDKPRDWLPSSHAKNALRECPACFLQRPRRSQELNVQWPWTNSTQRLERYHFENFCLSLFINYPAVYIPSNPLRNFNTTSWSWDVLHCLRWPGQLVAARTALRICGKSLVQRTGAFLSRCHLTIAKIRFSWLYWHLPSYNVICLPYDPIVSTCHGQELVYALIICYIFYSSCPRVDLGQSPCRIPITFHLFVGCPEKLGRFVFAHGRMRTKSACGCRCHPVQIDFTNEITASTFWSFCSAKKQQYDQFCQGYSPGVNSSYGFCSCKSTANKTKNFGDVSGLHRKIGICDWFHVSHGLI